MATKLYINSPLAQLLSSRTCCQAACSRAASLPALQEYHQARNWINRPRFSTARRLRNQEDLPPQNPPLPTAPTHPQAAPQRTPSFQFEEEENERGSEDEALPLDSSSLALNTQAAENAVSVAAGPGDEGTDSHAQNLSEQDDEGVRIPRSVQAIYLKPLRRKAKYGLPVCDLQIRSYSVVNLEFMADFALRAAYYLNLPARGPVPLPRITERWTVPRGNFVHKKSQENFERITMRRLIQIHDGHPETVEIWLAFIRKHAYYGVGMKANVWNYEKLGVGKTMDVSLENLKKTLEPKWAHFGRRKNMDISEKVYQMMASDTFQRTSNAPLQTLP